MTNRATYIDDLTQLRDRLKKLGIEPINISPGSAEIGFLIPRSLFHNHFDELIKELGALNYILRTISEVATGSSQPIEVRQISTSDPQFFFGMDPATITVLGGVVTWALAQWKQVEEIRKLRSETKKNSAFNDREIKEFFDSKIEANIKAAIETKTTELLGSKSATPPQRRIEVAWALESVLARVERGMTVEIKLVPPPATDQKSEETEAKSAQFSELEATASNLIFPAVDTTPILSLPPPEPEKTQGKAREAK